MASDQAGNTLTFNGLSWGYQTTIDGNPHHVVSLSCTATTFCAAISSDDTAQIFDGVSWSARVTIGSPLTAAQKGAALQVSCASSSFCVAVDGHGAALYDGTSWSAPTLIDPHGSLDGVSCPSATFCAAADWNGKVSRFNGISWTAMKAIGVIPDATVGNGLTAISCTSGSFCMVSDHESDVSTFTGSTWTPLTYIGDIDTIISLSCASGTFCMGMGADGTAYAFNNGVLTSSADIGLTQADDVGVSCTSDSFCASVAKVVNLATTFDGTNWSALVHIDKTGTFSSVSCPSVGNCVATDTSGEFATLTNGTWTVATSGALDLEEVSCPSMRFCAAIDGTGIVTYNGTTWSPPTPVLVGTNHPIHVSCVSSTFCMAIDLHRASYYNGTKWSKGVQLAVGTNLLSLSCATASFCVATDRKGNAFTWNGATWSATASINAGLVSCATADFCAAANGGDVRLYGPTGWSAPITLSTDYVQGLVSCTSSTACLVIFWPYDDPGTLSTFRYNGTSWTSAPNPASASKVFKSLSCATGSFCVAVDYPKGTVFQYSS